MIERYSYDAWGLRRDPTTWAAASITAYEQRGYTGHEHLDDIGIIHMNGRIYDPKLGRMLSPDPVTQAPENGQNYNRYNYANNNPLKFTDPTGYRWYIRGDGSVVGHNGSGGWTTRISGFVYFANSRGYSNRNGGNGTSRRGGRPFLTQEEWKENVANGLLPNGNPIEATSGDNTSGGAPVEQNPVVGKDGQALPNQFGDEKFTDRVLGALNESIRWTRNNKGRAGLVVREKNGRYTFGQPPNNQASPYVARGKESGGGLTGYPAAIQPENIRGEKLSAIVIAVDRNEPDSQIDRFGDRWQSYANGYGVPVIVGGIKSGTWVYLPNQQDPVLWR